MSRPKSASTGVFGVDTVIAGGLTSFGLSRLRRPRRGRRDGTARRCRRRPFGRARRAHGEPCRRACAGWSPRPGSPPSAPSAAWTPRSSRPAATRSNSSRRGAHHGHRRLRDERARPHPVRPRSAGQRMQGQDSITVAGLRGRAAIPLIVTCQCAVARQVVAP
jgi:hypothetical protein